MPSYNNCTGRASNLGKCLTLLEPERPTRWSEQNTFTEDVLPS